MKDGFIPRLCRSYMSSFDGDLASWQTKNELGESKGSRYFRLNLQLEKEMDLDDTACMDGLRKAVRRQITTKDEIRQLLAPLLMASFYFELNTKPSFIHGRYRCDSSIRCRNTSGSLVSLILDVFTDPIEFFVNQSPVGFFGGLQDVCQLCHRYSKSLTFFVRHLSEITSLVAKISEKEFYLSGFPQRVDWFVEQQQLGAVFGTADHGVPGAITCRQCSVPGNERSTRQLTTFGESEDQAECTGETKPSHVSMSETKPFLETKRLGESEENRQQKRLRLLDDFI